MMTRIKILLMFLFIILSFQLMSMVVFIEGSAEGKVVSIHKNNAFLVTQASGVKQNRLFAVNFIEKRILWETDTFGIYNRFLFCDDKILGIIEENKVVARNLLNGTVIWMIDLVEISTDKNDIGSIGENQSYREYRMRAYNQCIKDPKRARWFDYTHFMPDSSNLILFRTARYSPDGPTSHERDWICINIKTGKVESKGCYTLYGLSKNSALISDYRHLYLMDQNGRLREFQESDRVFGFSDASLSRRCFNERYISTDWFFVKKDCYQEKVKELMVIFPRENRLKLLQIQVDKGYYGDVAASGDYILHFSKHWLKKYKWNKGEKVFWAETLDLMGNRVQRIQKISKKSFTVSFLGQTQNGDALLMLDREIRRYSIPNLKLVSNFEIDEKKIINTYHNGLKCFDSQGVLVLCYILGNKWQTSMANRKARQTITFKFFDLNRRKKLWVVKRKIKYFRRKRNRDNI